MGIEHIQIGIFRHGASTYLQRRETTLEDANDLTAEGIDRVKVNVREFTTTLSPEKGVVIYSSPQGRTLHTSKVVAGTLKEQGIPVQSIVPHHSLTEVLNFQWDLFAPLVQGGEVMHNGHHFVVDARKTNPEGLSSQNYFMQDKCHDVSQKLRGELPDHYLDALANFEKFHHVSERMNGFLREIRDSHNGVSDIIAVTHEALVYRVLDLFSRGTKQNLDPGDYVHLEKRGNSGIYAKRAGRLTQGDTEAHILE